MSQIKNKLSPEHKQQGRFRWLPLTVNSTGIHDKEIQPLNGREGWSVGTSSRPLKTTDSVFSALDLRRVSCCAILLRHVGLYHRDENINKAKAKNNKKGKRQNKKNPTQQTLSRANSAKTHLCSISKSVSIWFSKTEASAFHINNYENTFSGHLA